MRTTGLVCLLSLIALCPLAANPSETRYTLDQIAAKAGKVKFEAGEVAAHLKRKDANLAVIELRLQLLEENTKKLRQLVADFQPAWIDAEEQKLLSRMKSYVNEVEQKVNAKLEAFYGPGAESKRKLLRSQARSAERISSEVKQIAIQLAE